MCSREGTKHYVTCVEEKWYWLTVFVTPHYSFRDIALGVKKFNIPNNNSTGWKMRNAKIEWSLIAVRRVLPWARMIDKLWEDDNHRFIRSMVQCFGM